MAFGGVTLLIAFLCSFIPGLIWLVFWLQEDRLHPEPRKYIIRAFLAGAFMVLVALALERKAQIWTGILVDHDLHPQLYNLALYAGWAVIEETLKFAAAFYVALRLSVNDEPVDSVIYMVTAALGFSVAENMLFLLPPIAQGHYAGALATGDLRFIGATLLHVFASGLIGVMLAFAFKKARATQFLVAAGGVILASTLHTLFNFSILESSGSSMFAVFFCIWAGIVTLLLLIERVKVSP